MGFRFNRRIRIAKGVNLNLGKRGVSASFGGRGARVTVGRKTRVTLGVPGTGLSYTAATGRVSRPHGQSANGCLGVMGCMVALGALAFVAAYPWMLGVGGLAALAIGAWRYIARDLDGESTTAQATFFPPDMPSGASDAARTPGESDVDTTTTELAVYVYAVRQLGSLLKGDPRLCSLDEVRWADYKTVFCVYYRQKRKGRLFNYRTLPNGSHHFEFPHSGAVIDCASLADIDQELVAAYMQRIEEIS